MNQKGFTLIELLLVIAVIAAVGVAAFVLFPKVREGFEASESVTIISSIQSEVANVFPTGRYENLNSKVAFGSEIFPTNVRIGDGSSAPYAQNKWQGDIMVYGSGRDGISSLNPQRYFTIIYPNVPASVCKKFASGAAGNFGRIAIGSNTVTNEVVNTFDNDKDNDIINEALVVKKCMNSPSSTLYFTSN